MVKKKTDKLKYNTKHLTVSWNSKFYISIQQRVQEFFGLRMRNFQGIVFMWTQIYREIFKSA